MVADPIIFEVNNGDSTHFHYSINKSYLLTTIKTPTVGLEGNF